jgi:hypothetical protein
MIILLIIIFLIHISGSLTQNVFDNTLIGRAYSMGGIQGPFYREFLGTIGGCEIGYTNKPTHMNYWLIGSVSKPVISLMIKNVIKSREHDIDWTTLYTNPLTGIATKWSLSDLLSHKTTIPHSVLSRKYSGTLINKMSLHASDCYATRISSLTGYSNCNVILAMDLVQRITSMDYKVLIQKYLNTNMGLKILFESDNKHIKGHDLIPTKKLINGLILPTCSYTTYSFTNRNKCIYKLLGVTTGSYEIDQTYEVFGGVSVRINDLELLSEYIIQCLNGLCDRYDNNIIPWMLKNGVGWNSGQIQYKRAQNYGHWGGLECPGHTAAIVQILVLVARSLTEILFYMAL